jgi:putative nucleotidyltransferase with HDIG domain
MDLKGIEYREWHLWFLTLILIMVLGSITVVTYLFILGETDTTEYARSISYRALGGVFLLITLFCIYVLHARMMFGKLRVLLVEMSSIIASTVELNVLLSAFASRIAHACSATLCQIALLTESGATLKLRSAHAVRKVDWKPQIGKTYLLGKIPACSQVITTLHPLVLRQRDLTQLPKGEDTLELLTGGLNEIRSVLVMPMITKDRAVGILILGEMRGFGRTRFSSAKMVLAQALARQAATAIDHARLLMEVIEKSEAIKQAHFDSIKALAEALETKDVYTRGHSERTVHYAVLIAKHLGLSEKEQDWIQYGAILHDIGKIGVPENILNKPGTLTEEEYEIMKRHPVMGAEIVRHIKYLDPVVPIILHDHERYDGTGYPYGLSEEAIPLGARIVALVDAYDAMTTDRVYRKAMTKEEAIEEIRRKAGTQFDPQLAEIFINILIRQE